MNFKRKDSPKIRDAYKMPTPSKQVIIEPSVGNAVDKIKIFHDESVLKDPDFQKDNFKAKRKIPWVVGQKIESKMRTDKWEIIKILEIDEQESMIYIHYDGWNARYDEWVQAIGDHIRPLVRTSARSKQKHSAFNPRYKVNEEILARWAGDKKFYTARIDEIVHADSMYKVTFFDGVKKTLIESHLRRMTEGALNELKLFLKANPKFKVYKGDGETKMGKTDVVRRVIQTPDDTGESSNSTYSRSRREIKRPRLPGDENFLEIGGKKSKHTANLSPIVPESLKKSVLPKKGDVPATTLVVPVTKGLRIKRRSKKSTPDSEKPKKALKTVKYKCRVSGCPKKFRNKDLRRIHYKNSHGITDAPEKADSVATNESDFVSECESQEDFIHSDSSDDIIHCTCDLCEEDGFMIQCEVCMAWQHGYCVGVDDKTVPENHICQFCKNPKMLRKGACLAWDNQYLRCGKLPSAVAYGNHKLTREDQLVNSLIADCVHAFQVLGSVRDKIKILDMNKTHFHCPPLTTKSRSLLHARSHALMTGSDHLESNLVNNCPGESLDNMVERLCGKTDSEDRHSDVGSREGDIIVDNGDKEGNFVDDSSLKMSESNIKLDKVQQVVLSKWHLVDLVEELHKQVDSRLDLLDSYITEIEKYRRSGNSSLAAICKGIQQLLGDMVKVETLARLL